MPYSSFLEAQEHSHANEEGQQIAGQVQSYGVLNPPVGQEACAGSYQKQGQMPGQGIQHYGGDGLLTHRAPILLILDQAGLQVSGDVLEALNILGPASLGSDLDKEQPSEDAGQDAHRDAGHPNVSGVSKAQLRHGRSHCSGGAVAAGESGSQQKSKAVVDLREQLGNHQHPK